jgi:RNA polymerase sigma factor (sigma-70 family)
MTFKEHRDKLRANKYEPIPNKELNQLAIHGEDRDRVVNSLQRLAVKAVGKIMFYNSTTDSTLFELLQVANESLAVSLSQYKIDKIDFSLYVYTSMLNAIISYLRNKHNIVKSSIKEKKRDYANYFYIDKKIDIDDEPFELEDESEELFNDKIDIDYLYKLVNKVKKRDWTIFVYHFGFLDDWPKKNKETALKFKISAERIRQIILRTNLKIKNSEEALEYLQNFQYK